MPGPNGCFLRAITRKRRPRRLARTNFGVNASAGPLYGEGGETTVEEIEAVKKTIYDSYPGVLKEMVMIAGTPDNVIPKLKKIQDILRPGIFSFWLDGPVPAKDRMRCLELLNRDVIPVMREHGKTLGLVDPFEQKPGSRPLANGRPEPVSDADALAELMAA